MKITDVVEVSFSCICRLPRFVVYYYYYYYYYYYSADDSPETIAFNASVCASVCLFVRTIEPKQLNYTITKLAAGRVRHESRALLI